jgi:hypothetical protein
MTADASSAGGFFSQSKAVWASGHVIIINPPAGALGRPLAAADLSESFVLGGAGLHQR